MAIMKIDHEAVRELLEITKILEAENERLRSGINTACVNIWSWAYGRRNKHILEIYRNLKAVVSGGRNG